MSRGRHRRPGQRRDAISGRWARAWMRIRHWRQWTWLDVTAEWRALAAGVRALSAILLDALRGADPDAPVPYMPAYLPAPARLPAQAPAPGSPPAQEKPRPADPPVFSAPREVRAGATTIPGAVTAADGTRPRPAHPPAPEAGVTATPSGDTATLPLPEAGAPPPAPPGQGQHPLPAHRGDYRPTQPFRAIPATVPVNVVRPYYPALEAWRDGMAVTR